MSPRKKAVIGYILGTGGLLGALYGLNNLLAAIASGVGGKKAAAILLGAVVVGIAGFMTARFQTAQAQYIHDPDTLAVETLAKLGKAMQTRQKTAMKRTNLKPPTH